MKFPEKFSLAALFVGSVMSDVEVILDKIFPGSNTHLAHSLIGIFVYILPLTLISTLIFLILVILMRNHFQPLQVKIDNQFKYWGAFNTITTVRSIFSGKNLTVIVYSAIIGGLLHIILDFPSHKEYFLFVPLGIYLVPDILRITFADYGTFQYLFFEVDLVITVYNILWIIETLIGGIISLLILNMVYRKKKLLI